MDLSKHQKNEAIYGLYSAVDPTEAKSGYTLRLWKSIFVIRKGQGWKYIYARAVNPITRKMAEKIGCDIICESAIDSEKHWMTRMDLAKDNKDLMKGAFLYEKPKL